MSTGGVGDGPGAAARPTTSSSARPSSGRKKTPEELSADIIHHTAIIIRSFYVAVAKSIHTPARRRDDTSSGPNLGMKAAALGLALVLKGNLEVSTLPEFPPLQAMEHAVAAGRECAVTTANAKAEGATAAAAAPGTAPAAKEFSAEDPAVVAASASVPATLHSQQLVRLGQHLNRLAEEAYTVLLDTRRRSCHVLILNYFVAVGGMEALAARFGNAVEGLWWAMDRGAAKQVAAVTGATAAVTAGGDTDMADAQAPVTAPAAGTAAAGGSSNPAAPAAPASTSSSSHVSKRDPLVLAEKAVQSFLQVYELLSSASLVFSASQAQAMLTATLPASAGVAAQAQFKEPVALMRAVQASIVGAVAPVWRNERLAAAPPAIMTQVVSVLNSCAEGTASAATVLLRPSGRDRAGAVGLRGFQPDPSMVQIIQDMGFSQARAELALRRVGVNSIEAAMEWLVMHPEEPPAAPAAPGGAAAAAAGAAAGTAAGEAGEAPQPPSEEDQLAEALAASLQAIGVTPEQLLPPTAAAAAAEPTSMAVDAQPATPATEAGGAAGDAGAGTSTVAGAGGEGAVAPTAASAAPQPSAATSLLGITGMVEGAVAILTRSPSAATAFSMADLLYTLAVKEKEEGREGGAVIAALMDLFRGQQGGSAAAYVRDSSNADTLLTSSRLLLIVLTRDQPSREAAAALVCGGLHRPLCVFSSGLHSHNPHDRITLITLVSLYPFHKSTSPQIHPSHSPQPHHSSSFFRVSSPPPSTCSRHGWTTTLPPSKPRLPPPWASPLSRRRRQCGNCARFQCGSRLPCCCWI